ncbi:hypothetical protein [Roseospira visakhapatnamensis]|uniref:Uncharacterized protein n=1 Tax=Roseospira visakhapatnamensis TaxID=390880 RepID=A0A7W6RFU4_9PROT|nr:hypothetical protein [Roseospira visakhapatnamensis]MBB4267789.1 hypothetical protein [Roseospira visakhapatnamensis]
MKAPAYLPMRHAAAWVAFWSEYPRKEGKAAAREVFAILTADTGPAGGVDPEFLVRAAGRYADQCRERRLDVVYVAHAKTWLRQRRFEDEAFQDPLVAAAGRSAATDDGPNAHWWPVFRDAGMTRSAWDHWIAPCRIDGTADGGVTIVAPSPFHANWLVTRLDLVLHRACGGMPDIEVM